MRLLPLTVGNIDAQLSVITGGEGNISFPIVSWLIEHPKGLILFDTGMHTGLQSDTSRLGRTAEFFRPDYHPGEEVSARLTQQRVRPSDITHIIFSHLHFDHAGGTVEIPEARIVIQEAEWLAAHDPKNIERGIYDPIDYDHGHDVEQVTGRYDVFGDGRIVCLPTPGHTPGHQALRVELDSGPVVLTGDCVYFEAMLDTMAVPKLGFDTEQQRASMHELRRLRDEDGCQLLFGHDRDQLEALPDGGLD